MDNWEITDRFINAIRHGKLETVRELINSYGLPYLQSWSKGYYLLCYALNYKHSEIAKLILERGCAVNSYQNSSNTPLHFAVNNSDIEIIKMLLDQGANINAQNILGETPLYDAIKNNRLEITELLLKHEADINFEDEDRNTPLFYAIENENLKITKLLLDNGANVEDYPELLHIAARGECTEIVELLLQHEADVNATDENGYTALLLNVSDCYEVSNRSLDRDSYVNLKTKITKLLLNHGANVDAQTPDGETPLHFAVYNGYSQVVEVLLEYNANVNVRKKTSLETPLHESARSTNVEICKMLLNKGVDVDAVDCDGFTALHMASQWAFNEVVTTLLEYGSDINIMTYNDLTPLYYAEIVETIEIFKRHIVQMKTANLYVSQRNLLSVDGISYRNFQEKCENEITSMKSEKMNNYISFYDILTKNTDSLAICLRNENIVQILKLDDYKTKFPIYGGMIKSRFRNGMKKKELLDQGNQILHFLFANHRQLPQECTEKICSYLSDEDLKKIIEKSILSSKVGLKSKKKL